MYQETIRQVAFPIGLVVVASFCLHSAHVSATAGPPACMLDRYSPLTVGRYTTNDTIDYNTYADVTGVWLYVPAAEGLTREWLQLSLQREFAAATTHAGDVACNPPDANHVQVTVRSAGNGFRVELADRDARSVEKLLYWASGLVHHHAASHEHSD